jgi:YHS domain-containing protein
MKYFLIALKISAVVIFLAVLGCGKSDNHESEVQEQMSAPDSTISEAQIYHVTADEVGMDVTDHVCNMDVVTTESTPAVEYDGKIYYFCSEYCQKEFMKDPQKYAAMEETQENQ